MAVDNDLHTVSARFPGFFLWWQLVILAFATVTSPSPQNPFVLNFTHSHLVTLCLADVLDEISSDNNLFMKEFLFLPEAGYFVNVLTAVQSAYTSVLWTIFWANYLNCFFFFWTLDCIVFSVSNLHRCGVSVTCKISWCLPSDLRVGVCIDTTVIGYWWCEGRAAMLIAFGTGCAGFTGLPVLMYMNCFTCNFKYWRGTKSECCK